MNEIEFVTVDETKLLIADAIKEVTEMIYEDRGNIAVNKNKIGTVERAVDKIQEMINTINFNSKAQLVGTVSVFGAVILTYLLG